MVREPDAIADAELEPFNIIPYSWPESNCETLMVTPNGSCNQKTKFSVGKETMTERDERGRKKRLDGEDRKGVRQREKDGGRDEMREKTEQTKKCTKLY